MRTPALILFVLALVTNAFGYSKVLIALGYHNGAPSADVEIIDLLSTETICEKPSNFSYAGFWEYGGLGFEERPIICGIECHVYEDEVWKISNSLNQVRGGFSMTKSPFQDGSKLFLTGGYYFMSLSSSEVLTNNGWEWSIPVPVTIHFHCMVTVNSTSVMVIGGVQNNQTSGNSFIFNSESNIWTEGPPLKTPRSNLSCGRVKKNNQSNDKTLIAVGGNDDITILRSVEALDFDSDLWRSGPDLPFEIAAAAIVDDPSGGVVLIGGLSKVGDEPLDTLYRLPHAGPDATWELMPQKLKTARQFHTAFLIPDEIAACN